MNLLEQYLQRSQDIIGVRTSEEKKYDNEVITHLKNDGDIRKAIKSANKIYPSEALNYDDGDISDVEAHYEYLLEHTEIMAKMGKDQKFNKPKLSNKIGRNDSCPCGSGKKYKKCCMYHDDDNKQLQQDYGQLSLGEEGVNVVVKGEKPSLKELERMTAEYQENIKKSPIWEVMVKEYGEVKAIEMLNEFQVKESGADK